MLCSLKFTYLLRRLVGIAEEKGRGYGLRSGVTILRPKAHLKIYVHFIFEGVGVNILHNCGAVTLGVTCMSAGNSFCRASSSPLLDTWLCELPQCEFSVVKDKKFSYS